LKKTVKIRKFWKVGYSFMRPRVIFSSCSLVLSSFCAFVVGLAGFPPFLVAQSPFEIVLSHRVERGPEGAQVQLRRRAMFKRIRYVRTAKEGVSVIL